MARDRGLMEGASRAIASVVGPALLLLMAGGCTSDGEGDAGVLGPASVDVAGEWSVEQRETFDPCGLFGGTLVTPWVVEDVGPDVSINVETQGICRENTYARTGDVVVRQSGGLFIDPQGQNCRATLTQTETFTFTDSSVNGTIDTRFEFDSGTCARPYPCDVVVTVRGTRCADCSTCN